MLKLKLQHLATWWEVLTHLKRPWCWEVLKAGREADSRGWDDWMASRTRWTWVWVSSRTWWCTGKPGVLQSKGSQRVGHDRTTELNWTELNWGALSETTNACRNFSLKQKAWNPEWDKKDDSFFFFFEAEVWLRFSHTIHLFIRFLSHVCTFHNPHKDLYMVKLKLDPFHWWYILFVKYLSVVLRSMLFQFPRNMKAIRKHSDYTETRRTESSIRGGRHHLPYAPQCMYGCPIRSALVL